MREVNYKHRDTSRRRRRRRKKSRRMSLAHKVTLLVSLIFILLFAAAVKFCLLPALTGSGMESYNAPPSSLISTEETKAASPAVTMDTLYSPCAILKELDSGDILASRNASERIYPASLTKIMTALLAIENTPDLDQPIRLTEELFSELYFRHASVAGFQPGESVKGRDLLYGILLPSGAECCLAFANAISGSEEAFTILMNRKAEELDMKNTRFANSTGLHEEGLYSTAEDLSILLAYALGNEEFRKVFTTSRYTTSPTDIHPDGITFTSSMFQSLDSASIPGGEILGGKTGYTSEAGLCLASLALINGREYILVTAGAAGDHQTDPYHILDAQNIYGQLGRQAE